MKKNSINIYLKVIIFSLLLSSCNKKGTHKTLTINVENSDTITKTINTKVNAKYMFIDKYDSIERMIKNNKTLSQIKGTYSFGGYEIENPINRIYFFLSKKDYGIPKLTNPNTIKELCLIDEIKTISKNDDIRSKVIENYSPEYSEYESKRLSFFFVNQKNDTIGFQHTDIVKTNNNITTIFYLSKSKNDFAKIKKEFADFLLTVKGN